MATKGRFLPIDRLSRNDRKQYIHELARDEGNGKFGKNVPFRLKIMKLDVQRPADAGLRQQSGEPDGR